MAGWVFDVDWVRPDGSRDTDIDPYESVTIYDEDTEDGRNLALRGVAEVISEFNEKYRDLPYGSPRP